MADRLSGCDCLALGPAMASADAGGRVMDALLPAAGSGPVVMDAACIEAVASRLDAVAALSGGAVLTPHAGEMAQLTGLDCDEIEARREAVAVEYAGRLDAVLLVKGSTTLIASARSATSIGTANTSSTRWPSRNRSAIGVVGVSVVLIRSRVDDDPSSVQ